MRWYHLALGIGVVMLAIDFFIPGNQPYLSIPAGALVILGIIELMLGFMSNNNTKA